MALPTHAHRFNNYVDPVAAAQRQFEGVLGRLLGAGSQENGSTRPAPYGVDIREDQDHFYVEAELPGFKKDEVDITLEDQTLTISAQRKNDGEAKKGDVLLNERRYSRFLRSFTLPPTVNDQTVNARLADGVLTITLNKREETKPRKITVS